MIAKKFEKQAANAARAFWYAEFGPIPGSAWEDIGHCVAYETANPNVGYLHDPEFVAWADAWDLEGNPRNHCGEHDYARRLTAALDYARLHFRA
jgi:hypothetical protein